MQNREKKMKIATLDIGGTSIKAGGFQEGKLAQVKEYDTDAKLGGDHVIKKAIEILEGFPEIDRIGISTAGQVDSKAGKIRYANSNIPGYTGMEIKKILEEKFKVPVAVENDVNAAAIGEAVFGAGRDISHFLCLTYGTGVGGAIVIDRQIYTGHRFCAGEFGAMVVHASDRNPKEDMFSGCYERYASTTALVKKALQVDETLKNGRIIFSRLEEEKVKRIVEEWILEIIYGLTTLIHIFNPTCVVLGGGIMGQTYVIKRIQELLYDNIMPSFHEVMIKQAELGNTAGLLGAAQCALEIGDEK